jgi:hypothetical protein
MLALPAMAPLYPRQLIRSIRLGRKPFQAGVNDRDLLLDDPHHGCAYARPETVRLRLQSFQQ